MVDWYPHRKPIDIYFQIPKVAHLVFLAFDHFQQQILYPYSFGEIEYDWYGKLRFRLRHNFRILVYKCPLLSVEKHIDL